MHLSVSIGLLPLFLKIKRYVLNLPACLLSKCCIKWQFPISKRNVQTWYVQPTETNGTFGFNSIWFCFYVCLVTTLFQKQLNIPKIKNNLNVIIYKMTKRHIQLKIAQIQHLNGIMFWITDCFNTLSHCELRILFRKWTVFSLLVKCRI